MAQMAPQGQDMFQVTIPEEVLTHLNPVIEGIRSTVFALLDIPVDDLPTPLVNGVPMLGRKGDVRNLFLAALSAHISQVVSTTGQQATTEHAFRAQQAKVAAMQTGEENKESTAAAGSEISASPDSPVEDPSEDPV